MSAKLITTITTSPSKTAQAIIYGLLTDKEQEIECPTLGERIPYLQQPELPPEVIERLSIDHRNYLRSVKWMGFYYVLASSKATHERAVCVFNILGTQIATAYSSTTTIFKYV